MVPEHAQRKGHRTLGFVFARGAPNSLTEIARISTNYGHDRLWGLLYCSDTPGWKPVHLANDAIRG